MFNTVKQIFEPKNKDLQKRILFTLAILIIYKIGTYITVPGVAIGDQLKKLSFLELFDVVCWNSNCFYTSVCILICFNGY